MIKSGNIFKSPLGKAVLFLCILALIVLGMFLVFKHKNSLRGTVVKAVNEPLEIVYNAPLSEISPDPEYSGKQQNEEPLPETDSIPPPGNNNSEKVFGYSHTTQKQKPKNNLRGNSNPKRSGTPTAPRMSYRKVVKPYTPSIGIYTADISSVAPDPNTIDAPYGQLLRCELTITVETSNLRTPVVGLVTSPLWWNGKEIIPAGVIVHGTAASSGMRDRVGTGTKWVLVWPHRNDMNGKELIVNAVALACDRTENAWGDIDGSAGIKGDVISNAEKKKIIAYIAKFVAGLGSGMVEESEESTGDSTTTTTGGKFQDALGEALANSAEEMANQLLKDLAKEATYVKAQAGTEFYLYITQDLIVEQASKGKLLASSNSRKTTKTQRQSNPPTTVRRATKYD